MEEESKSRRRLWDMVKGEELQLIPPHPLPTVKFLRSPGIDYKELIPPAYVTWRASTISYNHISTRCLAPIDCSQIPAQVCTHICNLTLLKSQII
jgi:hypothetical protein